jgi:CheY-like chemotaxis protein
MIVFVDDEKWIISAYLDELESKSKANIKYKPLHFFFATDALKFLKVDPSQINAIVLDIGMDFGDGNLLTNEPGGIQFIRELRNSPKLVNIPVIILSVYDKQQIQKEDIINLDSNPILVYISRDQPDRDLIFWKSVNAAIDNKRFK